MARVRIYGTSSDDVFTSLNLSSSSNYVYGRGGNDMLIWDYSNHKDYAYFHGGSGSQTTSIESFLEQAQQDVTMENPSIRLFSETEQQSGDLSGDVFVIRFADHTEFNEFLDEKGYADADEFYASLADLQSSLGGSNKVYLSNILGGTVKLKYVEHIAVVIDEGVVVEDNLLVVDTSNDVVDAEDGLLSLREAIQQVNDDPSREWVINFAEGITEVNLSLRDDMNAEDSVGVNNLLGDLDLINTQVSIIGDGVTINAAALIDDPENAGVLDRALHISGSEVTIDGMTFSGGYGYHHAGAVYAANSSVDIVNSSFVDNTAGVSSVVYYNGQPVGTVVTGHGGALSVNQGSVVSVENSNFSGNSSLGVGGAIAVSADSQLLVTTSDVSNNYAGSYGGGFYNAGSLELNNLTTSGNSTGKMFGENSYQSIQNSSVIDYYGSDEQDVFFFDLVNVVTNDTHYTVHHFNPDEDLVNLFPNYNVDENLTITQAGTDTVVLDFTGDGDAEITLIGVGLDVGDIRYASAQAYTGTENIVGY